MATRGWGRAALLVAAIALVSVPRVAAQFPLSLFKHKKKPPAQVVAPPPAAPAGQVPATAGAAPPPRTLTPEEQALKKTMTDSAMAAVARRDTSPAGVRERVQRWQQVLLLDPSDDRAKFGWQLAKDELAQAEAKAAQAGAADQTTQNVLSSKVEDAKKALDSGDWRTAQQYVSQVLSQQPGHPGATALVDRIDRIRRNQELKRLAIMVMAALVVIVAALLVVGRWGLKVREDRRKQRAEAAARRAAVLQIVAGVGRGKHVAIDKEQTVFKIGAAAGSGEQDRNDLVISDSASLVSRHHCMLIKKDGDYFVVDSSINGTAVNGVALDSGEHHPLEDGDEITIADVSRVKFLHT